MEVALVDRRDPVGEDLDVVAEQPALDEHAVEDVGLRVGEYLLDLADLLAGRAVDRPARLDQEPGDGVARHHQTAFPATRQTGPCVATLWVSERTCRTSRVAGIRSASRRSRQRCVISGEAP